jgi:choline-sulfatase
MFFRLLFISLCAGLLTLALFRAADDQKSSQKLNIIVISVESLRDDMITKEFTPELLKAAGQGLRFSNYRAVSGWTGTNIVSLLSGLSPFKSGVHTRGQSVDPDYILPLEQLADNGYLVQGLQPFMSVDIYRNLGLEPGGSGLDPKLWMARRKIEHRPFFLWYHYLKTHLPYSDDSPNNLKRPHSPREDRLEKVRRQAAVHFDETNFTPADIPHIRQLQASSVKEFDLWFKEFWDFYRQGGFWRDSILVLTADHGDEHGERGLVGHASTTLAGHLHEEIVRIPLIIWLPEGVDGTAADTAGMFSHIDIMPTLLSLVGISPAHHPEGRNILTAGAAESWFGMTSGGGFSEPDPENIRYFSYSCLQQGWKLHLRIDRDLKETTGLYNLAKDPGELDNLNLSHPDISLNLRRAIKNKISTRVHRPVAGLQETELSNREREDAPVWLTPEKSGSYTFDQLEGDVLFRWSGEKNGAYILEYRAGIGPGQLSGSLDVLGNEKNFGRFDRFYWNTWIVPQKRFELRVGRADGTGWSPWLTLEVAP